MADPHKAILTIPEVAELLQISRARAYTMARRSELPTVRLGKLVRVRRDRLEAWLDDRSR